MYCKTDATYLGINLALAYWASYEQVTEAKVYWDTAGQAAGTQDNNS